jgi:hypothetical protein
VIVELPFSWLATAKSESLIFNWMEKYAGDFYDLAGVYHFSPLGETESYWGSDTARYPLGTEDCVYILKRKATH